MMKSLIANTAGTLLKVINRRSLQNGLTVIVYHDVSDCPSEFSRKYDLNVTPDTFEYQIKFIKNEFNIISPKDMELLFFPPRSALITFDDGFKSIPDTAVPILERYKIPALLFLNMAAIRGEIFWGGLITYLCTKRKDFKAYFRDHSTEARSNIPIFLSCTKEIVESYMQQLKDSIDDEVRRYIGPFASHEDLHRMSGNGYIYYGNHLFNHYVPRLMSDDDFCKSFSDNDAALNAYSNNLKMFSFPFGQPDTCFQPRQIDLLKYKGVRKVFSSSGRFNRDHSLYCLDRLALTSFHNSPSKIWFQIFRQLY